MIEPPQGGAGRDAVPVPAPGRPRQVLLVPRRTSTRRRSRWSSRTCDPEQASAGPRRAAPSSSRPRSPTGIAVMDRTSPDVVRRSESNLERKALDGAPAHDESAASVACSPLVDIINRADRDTERLILEGLEPRDAELADEVRGRMFMFEDIVQLEDRAVQLVLRQVDTKRPGPGAQGRQATRCATRSSAQPVRACRREPARGDRAARPGPAHAGRGGPGSASSADPPARGARPDHDLAGTATMSSSSEGHRTVVLRGRVGRAVPAPRGISADLRTGRSWPGSATTRGSVDPAHRGRRRRRRAPGRARRPGRRGSARGYDAGRGRGRGPRRRRRRCRASAAGRAPRSAARAGSGRRRWTAARGPPPRCDAREAQVLRRARPAGSPTWPSSVAEALVGRAARRWPPRRRWTPSHRALALCPGRPAVHRARCTPTTSRPCPTSPSAPDRRQRRRGRRPHPRARRTRRRGRRPAPSTPGSSTALDRLREVLAR